MAAILILEAILDHYSQVHFSDMSLNKYILSWFSHNLLVNWSYFNNFNVFIRYFWQGRRPFWK